ncbi:MAG: hypothetical protein V1889_01290 [archaeon]
MRNARKLGLVGRVILGVGAVGGMVSTSGCDAVVGGYVGAKVAEKTEAKREAPNTEEIRGPEVPYDVNFLAYYRIQDLKTGEVEIVESKKYYGALADWENSISSQYERKYPEGYKMEIIKEGRLATTIFWTPNKN